MKDVKKLVPYLLVGVLSIAIAIGLVACGGGGGGGDAGAAASGGDSTTSGGGGTTPEPENIAFHFNEGSGNTTSSDSNGLHGEITGGAEWVPGKTGTALAFNQQGSQVCVLYDKTVKLDSQQITVLAWIRPHTVPTDRTSLIVGDSFSWKLELASGKPEFWVDYGLGSEWGKLVSGNTILAAGTWYHIAVTYDGSQAKMYINGAVIDTSALIYTIAYDQWHPNIFIGGSRGCCDFQADIDSFPGTIDDVKIFWSILSHADIAQTYSEIK